MDTNAKQRTKYRETMDEAIRLLGGKCVKCGSTDRLEFDHIDRETKVFAISKRADRGMEFIADELAKCQLLCIECHKAKSAEEHVVWHTNPHGGGKWGIAACDCDPCKRRKLDANNERRRNLRGPVDLRKTPELRHEAKRTNLTTGVRGVSLAPGETTYKVQVGYRGKVHYIGRFATLAEAEAAAIKARTEFHASEAA